MTDDAQAQSTSAVLNQVVESTGGESVRVEDLLRALGSRSYGPLLLLTSLLELLPIVGAIPGMYVLVASIVVLLAGQLALHRSQPWLPRRIRERTFSREKLVRALERSRPWAERIDRYVRPRLTFLLRPPFLQAIGMICIGMALLFFPLAFIPSSEKLLVLPVFVFGLALTADDGLVAAIGLAVTGGMLLVAIWYWPVLGEAFSNSWW